MKNNTIANRFAALALCFVLLFAAAPLPQAFAAPEDETGTSDTNYTEDGSEDTGEDTGDEEGDGTDASTAQPGATNTTNVTAAAANAPATNAEAALLISPDSGMVLYEKNADERRYPASTTKIMTALLVLENVADLNETVTAQASDFETLEADSSSAGIKEGETVTVEDLLYGLMLPSGNEAAYMLARHVAGSYEAFVDMMNKRAEELGCTGTHFVNPCGLHDDNHYTTAYDIYLIFNACIQNEEFVKIIGTASHTAQYRNPDGSTGETVIEPTNWYASGAADLPSNMTVVGGKTGTTGEAGNCLVLLNETAEGNRYISIVMGAPDRPVLYKDMTAMIETVK